MVEAGWRVAATPVLLLLLGGLTHRSRLQDVCHWSEVVDWTYRNAWESEAIRRHAVDQQLSAPAVLAVEPESTVGLEDRQERTVDPCLGLAGVEDVHGVLLVGSQKGRTLANTVGQKAVRLAALGRCNASILRVVTMCGDRPTGASVTGTAVAVAAAGVTAAAVTTAAVAAVTT